MYIPLPHTHTLSPHSRTLQLRLSHTHHSPSRPTCSLHTSISHSPVSVHTLQFCTYPSHAHTLSPYSTILYISLSHTHTLSPHSTILYIPLSHTHHSQSILYNSVHIRLTFTLSVHTLQFCTYPCLTLSSPSPHSMSNTHQSQSTLYD
jgi:hypothetical protein